MTSEVRDWLPSEAFSANLVEAALAGIVEEWASVWLSNAGALRVDVKGVEEILSCPSRIAVDGQAVAASFDGHGKRLVLELALGIRLDGASLGETDHRLLDSFSARLFHDLVERLDQHLGGVVTDGGGILETVVLTSSADGELVHLRLSQHALVPLIKRGIGTSPHTSEPVPRQQALAATPVALEAVLGKSQLSMDELRGLAVGDVLVLDRAVDGPIDLRIIETGQIIAAGQLQRNDSGVAVHL